jgi:tetratricopeptide (TPR) repeat protein
LDEQAAAAAFDDAIEIDLSDLLGDLTSGSLQEPGRAEYERGVALHDEGRIEESIAAFQNAFREPRLRFDAAAAIARLHRQHGDLKRTVDWFEQAAREPSPSSDASCSLLYEFAEALESVGDVERALAVCLRLQADAGDYRDVAVRIGRLARAQTRG